MNDSNVSVDPQAIANGVAQWNAASEPLGTWQAKVAAITALQVDSTWGTDEAGKTFEGSHIGDAGADGLGTGGNAELVGQIFGLGDKVASAAALSLGADQEQGTLMKIDLEINLGALQA